MSASGSGGSTDKKKDTLQAFGIPAWASLPLGIVFAILGAMVQYWIGKTAWSYV